MITSKPFDVSGLDETGLQYLACEISYGGTWINLNDKDRYRVSAQATMEQTSKSWRKTTAQSPVLGGSYLIHALPEMVSEQVSLYVDGTNQSDLSDNLFHLDELFEQMSYRLRWTFNEYREYWNCQLAESSHVRSQVYMHNQMSVCTYTVPRFPDVTRVRMF